MLLFEYELAAALFGEPGDWHRARRMLRAGVRFRWSTRSSSTTTRARCGAPVIRFQAPQIPAVRGVAAYFALAEEARWYSNRGPCHELLVERLERYLGPGVSCVPVANATLGLMVALRAMTGSAPDAGVRC